MAAHLIDEVLANRVTSEKALELWPQTSNSSSEVLSKAWTRLRHFADDEDLHKADKSYYNAEQERLKECIAELRAVPDIVEPK